jgi:alpha-tubulin suppressor-like RCC1 family protein
MGAQDVGGSCSGSACGSCAGSCRVVQAVAGAFHSVVLSACGAVRTAGHNAYGQLGHGDTTPRFWLSRVRGLEGARVRAVAAGDDHSAAVSAGGKVHVWGRGDWGQLGLADQRSHWKPMPLPHVTLQAPQQGTTSPWSDARGGEWERPERRPRHNLLEHGRPQE